MFLYVATIEPVNTSARPTSNKASRAVQKSVMYYENSWQQLTRSWDIISYLGRSSYKPSELS